MELQMLADKADNRRQDILVARSPDCRNHMAQASSRWTDRFAYTWDTM